LTCFSPLQVPNIHLWTANGYWLKQRPLPVKKGQPDCPACFETGGGASVALHHLMSGLLENFMYDPSSGGFDQPLTRRSQEQAGH